MPPVYSSDSMVLRIYVSDFMTKGKRNRDTVTYSGATKKQSSLPKTIVILGGTMLVFSGSCSFSSR